MTVTCRPSRLRQEIHHDLLKNRMLPLSRARLANATRNSSVCSDLRARLAELEDGFHEYNPAQLVSRLQPMRRLDGQAIRRLEASLDDAFRAQIAPLREQLVSARQTVTTALAEWERACRQAQDGTEQAFEALKTALDELSGVLRQLPRSMWLP